MQSFFSYYIRIFEPVESTVVLKDLDFAKTSKLEYVVTVLVIACLFIIATSIRRSKVNFAIKAQCIYTYIYIDCGKL